MDSYKIVETYNYTYQYNCINVETYNYTSQYDCTNKETHCNASLCKKIDAYLCVYTKFYSMVILPTSMVPSSSSKRKTICCDFCVFLP